MDRQPNRDAAPRLRLMLDVVESPATPPRTGPSEVEAAHGATVELLGGVDLPESAEHTETCVDGFLDAVKREQHAYLDALRGAAEHLKQTPGRLPAVAASQIRLTQQWFDAQRVFLFRQAVIDEETGRTRQLAAQDAAAILAAAHARVALEAAGIEAAEASLLGVCPSYTRSGEVAVASPVEQGECPTSADVVRAEVLAPDDRARHGFLRRTPRQKLAEFCVAAVRTTAEAAALGAVIDETFRDDEQDLLRQREELRGLLDSWWRATSEASSTSIEDAHAQASIVRHFAAVEADEVLERAGIDPCARRLRPVLPQAELRSAVSGAEVSALATPGVSRPAGPNCVEPVAAATCDIEARTSGPTALEPAVNVPAAHVPHPPATEPPAPAASAFELPAGLEQVLLRASAGGSTDVDAVLVELSHTLDHAERASSHALVPLVDDLVILPEPTWAGDLEWPLPAVGPNRRAVSTEVALVAISPSPSTALALIDDTELRRRWIPWEIVAPMIGMVAALTAVMAWIG